MPGGRPTNYKPEYCQMLIDHMASGLSFETFAAIIDTHRGVLYEWANKHQEFGDAKSTGHEKSELFWSEMGRDGTRGKIPGFIASTWIFTMKCRFKYRDGSEISKQKASEPDENTLKEAMELVKKLLKNNSKEKQNG